MTKKLLMVLGPTEVESEILEIGAKPQEYMRTQEYSNKLARIFKNLQYVFRTKNPVVFLRLQEQVLWKQPSQILCLQEILYYT
ncbi:hypothetical protein AGMMS49593_00680 [Endomicrobiia bacterium]|nr:hypothetical protein AGMMS49593_00680 [Endomicrobiia bacterium]